jgi:hypothetical protein
MSPLRGWLTPATRAALEAVLAKLAAPGMADPYVEESVLDGTPSQGAIDRDPRSPAQRNHDGLHGALRAVLASGGLRANGDIEWIPPPHLDHGQPWTNSLHHPEKLLRVHDKDDP